MLADKNLVEHLDGQLLPLFEFSRQIKNLQGKQQLMVDDSPDAEPTIETLLCMGDLNQDSPSIKCVVNQTMLTHYLK